MLCLLFTIKEERNAGSYHFHEVNREQSDTDTLSVPCNVLAYKLFLYKSVDVTVTLLVK